MARLLFFTSHNLWTSHFETELELIQNAIENGHEVHQLACYAELSRCDHNLHGDLATCLNCLKRRKVGAQLLSSTHFQYSIREFLSQQKIREIENLTFEYETIDDIKSIAYDGEVIGIGVVSSLISLLRSSTFNVNENRSLVMSYLRDTILVYLSVKKAIDLIKPDEVYFFNGRFAHVRAAKQACVKLSVDFRIHERGHDIHHYEIYRNHLPHSISDFTLNARELWEKSNPTSRVEIGKQFYKSRKDGASINWYSFVKEQKEDLLPIDWDGRKQNIVIFNSSEDEMASIGDEWTNDIYASQLQAVKAICKDFSSEKSFHFYLRMHPNLANAQPSEYLPFYELDQFPNLTVIKPKSEVSTYKLIDSADKIISFGSTVGIEANYWGKPSILAGKTFYKDLDVTYNPVSHEELLDLVKMDLQPKEREGSLIYGFYFLSFGKPFEHVRSYNFDKVLFKDRDLSKVRSAALVKQLTRFNFFVSILRKLNREVKLFKRLYSI